MANSLPKHYVLKLKNGLTVVAIPLHNETNVVSTNIFYKVGSKDEVMGKSGIAHMLEHLNFKSTKNLKAGEFDEIVKGYGGVNNASTGFDYTNYFIKSSSENMGESLKLFAELMENLKLNNKEFQPERDVVLEERLWRTDNSPLGYLYFRLFNHAFTYHPYHWTPIGFKEDIKNWTITDIKQFHKTYYQPKNAIIVVAGDIEEQTVFNEAKKYFQKIKNQAPIPKKHEIEPQQDGAKRIEVFKQSDVQMVAIAYKIPNFAHDDQVALSALSELLSSGKSSYLRKVLVDKKQLVNEIYGYNMEAYDPNLFLFLAVCNPNVEAKKVEKEILEIIKDVKNGKVKKSDIQKIKINTRSSFIHSLENSSSIASLYGSYFAKGDINPLINYEENIENLTKEDIIRVCKKYLIEKNSTTLILRKDEG